MKNNIRFFVPLLLAIISVGLTSCYGDSDNSFRGANRVMLWSRSSAELEAKEGETLHVEMLLAKTLQEDLTLTFGFDGGEIAGVPVVEYDGNPVTIKAGEKTASITIRPVNADEVAQTTQVRLTLVDVAGGEVSLWGDFVFMLNPRSKFAGLTPEQEALVDGYAARGLDIRHWIGEVPVSVKVERPGDGGYEPFLDPSVSQFTGTTVITLSENATAQTPVLKMTHNAMGLRGYLYDMFRAMTVLNSEYWLESPSPQVVMGLTGLSATSVETFELALDNIVVNDDGTLDFVTEGVINDQWDSEVTVVDFTYIYSAWERMKQMMEDGNAELQEAYEQGGSIDPVEFFNRSSIDEDEWGGDYWIAPSSSYNTLTGEMRFVFPMDWEACGDYMRITVNFGSAKL
ncbi:DUF4929 domain-containing protein [Alistipes sp. OttesenSCG-928-B03]|nr:DUF4929 domain-containing protein [Alistipes sp. OttesenSCG-928-B03]